ncbi:citrate synthase [Acidaminobacter sp. JC074]|uniref:citrate synthase n=1 Tax=Acidaminobacter sp. JC074 TaxID=2530199 RepID=UPI001F0D8AC0|nr:citrate synthase [Acidaminobacter sp. JC074]MCH4888959.1 citrate synthase [Acidaminobacter sp. JC074]
MLNPLMIEKALTCNTIPKELFKTHNVKSGLRNSDGTGVLVGLTKIGNVKGYDLVDSQVIPSNGQLTYRDHNIHDIIKRYEGSTCFEQTAYLLLFGHFPDEEELESFNKLLSESRTLPPDFTENMILKNPSKSIMNKIQRSLLVLYSYDDKAEDMTLSNQLMQCIRLIAFMPTIISYGYHAKAHYFQSKSLYIHKPDLMKKTAANILHMLRPDNSYTPLEEHVLDLLLVLHAEHGGGNNSTFTTTVVTSTGTDTYSAMAAAVGSLKGPKHGGANELVGSMIDDIIKNCNYKNKDDLRDYLLNIMDKKTDNHRGLLYGLGHAVYTKSDPRAEILKAKAKALAIEKNKLEVYDLYESIENTGKSLIYDLKNKHICANTDFYANLVYRLLEIPKDLYTPLFATARIVGWSAHRLETLLSNPRILRPAYKYIK